VATALASAIAAVISAEDTNRATMGIRIRQTLERLRPMLNGY